MRPDGAAEYGNGRAPADEALPDGRTHFFQIGMQRCGTTSIALFLERCGIPCVHYDEGRLAKRIRVNLAAGGRPLAGYDERYLAFTNMDWNAADDYFDGFKHFGALRRAYGGRFILNTRPMEHWVRSIMSNRAQRGRRQMLAHYALRFGTTDLEEVAQCWRAEREAHHRRVLAEIPADELLVFDIERDPPDALCRFAGLGAGAVRHWGRENPSPGGLGRALAGWTPRTVMRRIPEALKRPARQALRRR